MAEKSYNIVFSGKLVEGRTPQAVLKALCVVLECDEQQVRALFRAGFGAVIAKDLDNGQAYAMRERLREAGAICTVQEVELPPQEPPSGCMLNMDSPPAAPSFTPRPDFAPRRPAPPAAPKSGVGLGALVKLLLVAGLAGGGWWGYQQWFAPPSPAFQAYSRYSEAMARGQYQAAAEGASGEAKEYAESMVAAMAPASMKIYGREFTMSKPPVSEIAGEIAWIKRKRNEERKKDDGTVVIRAEETVCRIPPGVSSALCKWPVSFRDDVEVVQDGGTWKVSLFREERLTPQ